MWTEQGHYFALYSEILGYPHCPHPLLLLLAFIFT